jgi:2-keto-3-deoxy-L-rhamnonate aldolase RhmA
MNESVLSKLSNCLAGSGKALCAWVTMNEPAVAEALAREAFDAVVLDMQHGAVDFEGAMRAILRAAFAGKCADRPCADRRICPGQPTHGLRRLRNPRADDQ